LAGAQRHTGAYRAVKIVYRRSFDDDRPFEREFSGIRNFEPISRKHDSQVDVLHVGRGEDCFYYIMELADDQFSGQAIARDTYAPKTLKSELCHRGRLPFDECVQISLALTTALEHLHSHGLVHRDVKPSNIIFVNGVPKLADIGLVTGVDATRSLVGTEGFAAPEGPGTPQADIYSLGKVLYELCTGKDRGDFPELPTTLAELPDCEGLVELNAVIGKACREDPRARYQSARAMHDELLLLQSGKSLARMRAMERAVAKLKRVSAGIAVLTLAATVAFVYQSRQTRLITKLLRDNIQLAQASKRAAAESLNRLVQSQMAEATRFLGEGDPGSALPSLVEALRNVQGDKSREPMHRVRLESVFENHPKLFRLFVDEKAPLRCGFTPDGRKLFSQLKNGELKVYDLMSGGLLFTCSETNKPYAPNQSRYSPSAFFSADGTRLILRGLMPGVSTEIYDMTDGHSICPPPTEAEPTQVLDSIDGRVVLIADGESTARVVEVDSGQPLSPLIHASGPIQCGRLSQDDRCLALLVATASEPNPSPRARPKGTLPVWSVDSGQAIGSPITVERDCRFLLSRTGQRLAVAPLPRDDPQHERPTILDVRSGQEAVSAPRLLPKTECLSVSPDHQWLVCSEQKHRNQFYDLESGQLLEVDDAGQAFRQVDLSADGLLLATATDDGTARVWNAVTGELMLPPLHHGGWCLGVAFSPEQHLLATCAADKAVRIWDLAAAQQPEVLLRAGEGFTDVAFAPDGRSIVTLSMGPDFLRIWDAATGQPLGPPLAHNGNLASVRFSPDGKRLAAWPIDDRKLTILGTWQPFGALL
jgi:WD40 repeat protein